jgi:hypothetical protein
VADPSIVLSGLARFVVFGGSAVAATGLIHAGHRPVAKCSAGEEGASGSQTWLAEGTSILLFPDSMYLCVDVIA